MGLPPSEAKSMTFKQFLNYILGFRETNEDEWARTRLIGFYSVKAAGGKVKTPQGLFKLPSEIQQAKEEKDSSKEAFKRYLKKHE